MITETKKPSPKYYYTDQPEAEMAESSTNYFDARDEAVGLFSLCSLSPFSYPFIYDFPTLTVFFSTPSGLPISGFPFRLRS